jgi:predicted dehydrogenase
MAKKVRVGVIGTGGIAQGAHLGNYAKIEGVEIAALCDVNPEALKKTAEKYPGAKTYTDYHDLAEDPDVDAVSVCTPNFLHMEPTIACLKAGKHVLVEKPIARNAAEGRQMVRAAKEAGKLLAVGLHHRYNEETMALRRFRDEGGFGEIYYSRVHVLRRRGIPGWGVFGDKEKQGGGPLVDIGVHLLYEALYIMDFPKAVAASGATYRKFGNRPPGVCCMGRWDHKNFTVEDYAVGFIRFEGGMTMSLEASFAANTEGAGNVWIMGDKAGAKLRPMTIYREEFGTLTDSTAGWLPQSKGHFGEIQDFIAAVRGEGRVGVTGEEGLAVTLILDAIYKSAEEGREVAVEDMDV